MTQGGSAPGSRPLGAGGGLKICVSAEILCGIFVFFGGTPYQACIKHWKEEFILLIIIDGLIKTNLG